MAGHPAVVDALIELVRRPLLSTIQFCEAELADRVAVVHRVLPVDHRIVAVDAD